VKIEHLPGGTFRGDQGAEVGKEGGGPYTIVVLGM
jgi:hypothetical protein